MRAARSSAHGAFSGMLECLANCCSAHDWLQYMSTGPNQRTRTMAFNTFSTESRRNFEPESPEATANYSANRAPKLGVLLKIYLQIATVSEFEACRQLVFFCDWAMISFVIIILFLLMSVSCECIRASHEDEQRQNKINKFNNPGNPLRVLISTHKLIDFNENFQNNCNAMMIVEAGSGLKTMIQDLDGISGRNPWDRLAWDVTLGPWIERR